MAETVQKVTAEEPSQQKKKVQIVREWIENHENLHGRTDDGFILAFLHFRGFNVEKAKKDIEHFYTVRKKYPEWMQNRDPTTEVARKLHKLGLFIPIKTKSDIGLLTVVRQDNYDTRIIPLDVYANLGMGLMEHYIFSHTKTQTNGIIGLVDMNGIQARTIACCTIPVIKKYIEIMFRSYPARVHELHLIRAPKIFDALLNIAMWFLPTKIKNAIHKHGSDISSLHQYIPIEDLPAEYGGTNGTLKELIDKTEKDILDLKEFFRNDTYGYITKPTKGH